MDATLIRNMKDIHMLLNQISQTCFQTCIGTILSRDTTDKELACIEKCADKHLNVNHKVMEVFMEVQPAITRRKVEEYQKAQEALEAAEKEKTMETVES